MNKNLARKRGTHSGTQTQAVGEPGLALKPLLRQAFDPAAALPLRGHEGRFQEAPREATGATRTAPGRGGRGLNPAIVTLSIRPVHGFHERLYSYGCERSSLLRRSANRDCSSADSPEKRSSISASCSESAASSRRRPSPVG